MYRAERVIRANLDAIMDGHGPVEHFTLCRRLFGQSRRRALGQTWLAYWVNILR